MQERNRISFENDKAMIKFINDNIHFMEQQLSKVESLMKSIVKESPDIKKIYDMIMNIKGCGEIAAMGIVALMPEIGTFTRGEIASIVGVAPFNNDSGSSVHKTRNIKEGRKTFASKIISANYVGNETKRTYQSLCG